MPTKTVPFSVRLSEQDAEFIANLQIEGAVTPSEKIRAIIKSAREKEGNKTEHHYEEHVANTQKMLLPIIIGFRSQELQLAKHSELIEHFIEWISEALPYALSLEDLNNCSIEQYEQGIAERVFLLLERILRLGITQDAPCYDKKLIANKLDTLRDLIEMIQKQEMVEEA